MLELLGDAEAWILAGKLPRDRQPLARRLGLSFLVELLNMRVRRAQAAPAGAA